MAWYRAGTVSVTNGSATVTGAGTDFVSNASVGEAFLGPDGRTYEITQVVSATQIVLGMPYQGAGAGGQGYAVLPTQSFARDLARGAAELLNTFAAVRDSAGQGLFPDGAPAAPGIRFGSDQDTGWRRVGANVAALVAGGIDRLTIDGNGAFVTGPRMAVSGSTVSDLTHSTNVANWSSGVPDGANRWRVIENQFGSEMVSVLPNGNVGFGTITPSARMHIRSGNTTLRVESSNAGATDTQVAIATPDRQWNIGQNVGGSGVGTLNIFDVTGGALRLLFATDGAVRPGIDNAQQFGTGSFRWSVIYSGTGSINTSDAREKKDIGDIPAEWLDAWGDVQWQRFRFRDAVKAKGEEARWHLGLIAQQVQEAFAARGLDAREIGLLCHDEWEATPAVKEVRDEEGEIVTHAQPARKAGDRWGLRYDECQAIEAAWQRRRISDLEAAVAALTAQHG
ncbi:tail fiber domain-containing protein [Sphingomonas sp. NY01]|uniref:tail fiber domain-containing protein n=1 Tax=Sphingomonas sp. NY01 TaxID=2968057 RepID=UPI00315DB347